MKDVGQVQRCWKQIQKARMEDCSGEERNFGKWLEMVRLWMLKVWMMKDEIKINLRERMKETKMSPPVYDRVHVSMTV